MRILWIEDDTLEISDFFGPHQQFHDIEKQGDFSTAYQTLERRLRYYDVLVIDIDLRHSDDQQALVHQRASLFELSGEDFLKEAGFHLYLNALEQGFPKKRMAFLTGNMNPDLRSKVYRKFKAAFEASQEEWDASIDELKQLMSSKQRQSFDEVLATQEEKIILEWLNHWLGHRAYEDTYEKFVHRFKEARVLPPKAFDKKDTGCAQQLQAWLASHCDPGPSLTYDYLTLRRGMLDVMTELLHDPMIQFNPEFAKKFEKNSFLQGLAWQLRDFDLPRKPHKTIYFALSDFLSKPFEIFSWEKLKFTQAVHFKCPLYFLRNWMAHGLIWGSHHTQLSAQAVGIIFLFAFNAFFNIEKYGQHEELKRLFFAKPIADSDLLHLRKVYHGASNEEVLQMIRDKGFTKHHWQQENYLDHFYASYLLCVQNRETLLSQFVFYEFMGRKNESKKQ